MDSLFKRDLLYNCLNEEVYVYYLPNPVTKELENFIDSFGKLKYPLGEGFSFIRLETKDFLLTGNVGLKELRLTIKHGAAVHPVRNKSPEATAARPGGQISNGVNIKDIFEIHLNNYLRK